MITALLFLLLYVVIAVIVLELIFWILSLVFAPFVITARIRGLLYALLLILVIIYAIKMLG